MSKIAKFVATFGFVVVTAGAAHAMPVTAPLGQTSSIISLAAFGCGPGMHPNAFNRCVPNRGPVMVRPAPILRRAVCPRGTHLNDSGRRCVPNRF